MHTVLAGSSFMAQEPDRLHFGLRTATTILWIAVRWIDGTHTVVGSSPVNSILTVQRTALDATGDVDFDGDTDIHDLVLLRNIVKRPKAYAVTLAGTPYQVLGDIDGNNVLDATDVTLLDAMIP
jgi:hypothetical protein